MTIIERFLNYIKFDTQSNPYTKTTPSTKGQLELAKYLIEELKQIWKRIGVMKFYTALNDIGTKTVKKYL